MHLIPARTLRVNRRGFLTSSTVAVGTAALAAATPAYADPWLVSGRNLVTENAVILFQGDSITHAGRSREKASVPNLQPGLGHGYVWLAAAELLVRCGAVTDKWFPEFDTYRAAAKRVTQQHQATFVPFQTMFDEVVKLAPAEHWAGDGVHPSAAGAALMAHFWVKAVGA